MQYLQDEQCFIVSVLLLFPLVGRVHTDNVLNNASDKNAKQGTQSKLNRFHDFLLFRPGL